MGVKRRGVNTYLVEKMETLVDLNLAGNSIAGKREEGRSLFTNQSPFLSGVKSLASSLPRMKALKRLNLGRNFYWELCACESMEHLLPGLIQMDQLTELDLSFNCLTDKVVKILKQGLPLMKSLTKLNLGGGWFTDDGAPCPKHCPLWHRGPFGELYYIRWSPENFPLPCCPIVKECTSSVSGKYVESLIEALAGVQVLMNPSGKYRLFRTLYERPPESDNSEDDLYL